MTVAMSHSTGEFVGAGQEPANFMLQPVDTGRSRKGEVLGVNGCDLAAEEDSYSDTDQPVGSHVPTIKAKRGSRSETVQLVSCGGGVTDDRMSIDEAEDSTAGDECDKGVVKRKPVKRTRRY